MHNSTVGQRLTYTDVVPQIKRFPGEKKTNILIYTDTIQHNLLSMIPWMCRLHSQGETERFQQMMLDAACKNSVFPRTRLETTALACGTDRGFIHGRSNY